MMELRKCCNHPYLINGIIKHACSVYNSCILLFFLALFLLGAELKIVHDFQKRFPEREISEALIQASGKLVLVDKLLPKLKENGHKVYRGTGN